MTKKLYQLIDRSYTFSNIYTLGLIGVFSLRLPCYGTIHSIFVDIQPDLTNIRNTLVCWEKIISFRITDHLDERWATLKLVYSVQERRFARTEMAMS